jgi:hypothetical protein
MALLHTAVRQARLAVDPAAAQQAVADGWAAFGLSESDIRAYFEAVRQKEK